MMENHKARILVADDDEMGRRLIEAMLTPKGYEVIMACDGIEALNIARTENPDLILLDIMMPGMDGYLTLSKIKEDESTASIPVIMVTAVGYDYNIKLADELGASGYITKPFDLKELRDTVANLLSTNHKLPE
ncbi:MAG: response regulator [Dehalococcoidales bacterium]|jgi:two-component system alkaline phosphatase synthesis response regulator PhoP|nr:response regulator [Dehalococcoidales bacterium]MDD4322817.1 response regulator [Dehalococcoidales bacterium]MDD4794298.1 response regulator [Dehalococcoidales bacterium]MDD5122732.1 response regulator [Dehalococcoidales bacterium]MDX9803707.1 response regulator [Dehalococcoidales bacterium]